MDNQVVESIARLLYDFPELSFDEASLLYKFMDSFFQNLKNEAFRPNELQIRFCSVLKHALHGISSVSFHPNSEWTTPDNATTPPPSQLLYGAMYLRFPLILLWYFILLRLFCNNVTIVYPIITKSS